MEFERNLLGEHIVMGIMPWFHAFGMTVSIIMAVNTSKIVFLPKFEEKHFLSCIEVIAISLFNPFETLHYNVVISVVQNQHNLLAAADSGYNVEESTRR